MSTSFIKTWQYAPNYKLSTASNNENNRNATWFYKAFLKGDINPASTAALSPNIGLWTCYGSCDGAGGASFGNGDGIDYWGAQGASTGNTGVAGSVSAGAAQTGWVRLTGLAGMTTASVGHFMTISGAASAGNNSATNTPWRIVNFVSSSSVDIFNPAGVTGDANNGAITWTERNVYTFDSAKIVNAAAASNHSWFVLKSPVGLGPFYLIIDCNSATLANNAFVFCKTAPTGGTATARPTSTDEFGFPNGAHTVAGVLWYYYAGLATDGNFYVLGNSATNGTINSCMIFQSLANPRTGDGYPAVQFFKFSNAAEVVTQTNLGTAANWFGRKHDGSATVVNLTMVQPGFGATLASIDISKPDYTDGKYGDFPTYIFNNTAAYYTIKGRLVDITGAPTNAIAGLCEPNATNPLSFAAGHFWFPGNISPITK